MPARLLAMLLTCCFTAPASWCELPYELTTKISGQGGFSGPNLLIDATGASCIVACERDIGVVCLDLAGNKLWQYPMENRAESVPAVGDIDGDGKDDIVAADTTGHLVALNARGELLWSAQLPGGVIDQSCPAIADLDGDGAPEVLAGGVSGTVSCLDASGKLRWRFTGDGTRMGPLLVADIYDAPGKEIIVTSHDSHIYALTARGEWLWDLYTPDDLFPNTSPLLADVDGDDVPELYIAGGLHHFYRIDLRAHAIVLAENVYLHINGAIAASDIDGDGRDEVVFGNKNGAIWCYGADGFEWTREFRRSSFNAGPVLVDLDGDPGLEILFHSGLGDLQAVDSDGTPLCTIDMPCKPCTRPLVGDLDGDGKLEMVTASMGGYFGDGNLLVVDFDVAYREDPRNRVVFGGDRAHTGRTPGSKTYPALPTPLPVAGPGNASAELATGMTLLSGSNTWRFDVANPDGQRLALLVALTDPGGDAYRFVRHVRGAMERMTVTFDVALPGEYAFETMLTDGDTLALLASRQERLEFEGFQSDVHHLEASVFGTIQQTVESWRATNPGAAGHVESELIAMKGTLMGLAGMVEADRIARVATLRDSAERLRDVAVSGSALAPEGSFFAWEFNPWAYFDGRDTIASPGHVTERLATALCKEEYESLALNVTNVSGKTLDVRVAAEGLDAEHIELRRAVTVPTLRRGRVADALVGLDAGGLLTIPPLETRQLWITVNAKGLDAGDHAAELSLDSLEPGPTQVVLPLEVHVHALALPRPRPLRFCTWSYDGGTLGTDNEGVLDDLVEHGNTVYFGRAPSSACDETGALTGPLDFAALDESVKRLSPHGILLFSSPQGGLSGQPFLSEPWRKAFVIYMRAWSTHMKEIGLDYADWALYIYDEPSTPFGATAINTVEVARLVDEADPGILIYANPTSGTTMETVEMFTGLVDIWCPSSELLERLGPELVPAAKRAGKEVWFYDAAGRAKTLSCLGIYRWRFWYAWNLGFTGVGWWCHSHGAHLAWDGPNPEGDFFATVYAGPNGTVVSSKRWEAAREGIEDYEYLWLLRETIGAAGKRGASGAELERARELLEELPKTIEAALAQAGRRVPLTPDGVPLYDQVARRLDEARAEIVAACLALAAGG